MAITYQGNASVSGSNLPLTTTAFTEAINTNDLIVLLACPVQNDAITIAASDNLNSGSYTVASTANYSAGSMQMTVLYKVCNASGSAGTTTITVTGSGAFFTYVAAMHYNGFVQTPTLIPADVTTNSGSSATGLATGFNNSQNNELCVLSWSGANGRTVTTPSGWTQREFVGTQLWTYDQSVSFSGTAISASLTLSSSTFWQTSVVGFYDAPAGAAIAWIT